MSELKVCLEDLLTSQGPAVTDPDDRWVHWPCHASSS